jgi:putative nucleotidyltransferase with HDIG domain
MKKAKLPTREECFVLLREHNVPDSVIKHSLTVNKVAVFLAKRLRQAGVDIDVEVVDRAALLHDLDKVETSASPKHGELTEKILAGKGWPLLGKVAKQHRYESIHDDDLCWEAKVLNYADKRVMHTKVAPLQVRLDEAWERFKAATQVKKRDIKAVKLLHELEKEIFSIIMLKPENLQVYVK